MQYPIGDSHVHPDFSVDATGTVREYCQKAFESGLFEITFTTHYEILPNRKDKMGFFKVDGEIVPANADAVKKYIEEVRTVGEDFFPAGLKVQCGLEIGWDISLYDQLAHELGEFDLDFVMGSVHDVHDVPILEREFAPQYFSNHPIEGWIAEYFAKCEQIAESGLFNVLAHFDCYKRYGLEVYGDPIRTAHRPFVGHLFDLMRDNNLALEVNTSGLRHVGEYYPSMEILNDARRHDVKVMSLGSDAHRLEHVAYDFDAAISLVHELLPCSLEE